MSGRTPQQSVDAALHHLEDAQRALRETRLVCRARPHHGIETGGCEHPLNHQGPHVAHTLYLKRRVEWQDSMPIEYQHPPARLGKPARIVRETP
jgi:hypothetical protein